MTYVNKYRVVLENCSGFKPSIVKEGEQYFVSAVKPGRVDGGTTYWDVVLRRVPDKLKVNKDKLANIS